MQMRAWIAVLAMPLLLSGCGESGLPFGLGAAPPGAPLPTVASLPEGADASPGAAAGPPPASATTVEAFDTTSAAERAAAAAAPPPRAAAPALGTTIASLGNPAAPGFWAETPLVDAVRPGRLTDPATGNSVQVELRPSGGAPGSGTRVSLPAFRVLDLPLTALPELSVTGL